MKKNWGDEKSEIYGEKIKKEKIIVISRDNVLYSMLKNIGYMVKLYESAFILYEEYSHELEDSLIIKRKDITYPKELDFYEYETKQELNTVAEIPKYFEIKKQEINTEEEKANLLHKRAKKIV